MEIFVRADEGCEALPLMPWDSVWNNAEGRADWALAGPAEAMNRGGLQAVAELSTAVVLALFTDKRCPSNHPLAKYAGGDLRGYWGDGVDVRTDLGETELGSLLWLLERSVATPAIVKWAQSLAQDALAPLVSQGACAKITVAATLLPKRNGIALDVRLYAQDGTKIFDRRFEAVWSQIGASSNPLPLASAPAPALAGLATGGGLDLGDASTSGVVVTDLGSASDGTAYVIDLGDAAR